MSDAFVSFSHVSKVYRTGEVEIRAADDVTFSVNKGEFVIIVGPSGAGKTTVPNMLGGMDACSGGTITVDGAVVSDYSAKQLTGYRRHDIGFVFQFYNLVQNLTALENVELAAQICRDPLDAATVLDEVGLTDRKNNFPAQLSGGEQQRVAGRGSCPSGPSSPPRPAPWRRPGGPGRSGPPAPRSPKPSGSAPGCKTGIQSRCRDDDSRSAAGRCID